MTSTTDYFQRYPHRLFLVDGVGALYSAFMLGVVLVHFQEVFGIPYATLYLLAAIPCGFVLYDLLWLVFTPRSYALGFRVIGVLNLLYCLLSLGLAALHRELLTAWGWGYIIAEVIVVVGLAFLELRVGRRLSTTL